MGAGLAGSSASCTRRHLQTQAPIALSNADVNKDSAAGPAPVYRGARSGEDPRLIACAQCDRDLQKEPDHDEE